MSSIKLTDVSLSYPLIGTYARSIKQNMLNTVARSRITEHHRVTFVDALKNIDFELNRGDRLGLIGRNGAGKSTLLKVLAGIYHPSAGSLEVSGTVSPLLGISVGMNPLATGYENIKLRCLLHGFDKKKTQAIIADIEEFTELGHFLSMPVKTYSSGMNVRLSFALATAITPDILLLDEVVGAGDAHFINKAQGRMNQLIDSSNILVLASHANDIIKKFCNKILWLDQGKIVLCDQQSVDGILNAYQSQVSA